MKVTMLGSGGSGGVPLIGCACAVCRSPAPRNRRSRVSIVVENASGARILVDTSPDLRQQFLANDLTKVDAVSLSHAHADHLHGLDDLRAVNYHRNAPLEIWADAATLREATARFAYAFDPPRTNAGIWYAPSLVAREIPVGETVMIAGMTVRSFHQIHGGTRPPTLGLRFGSFAYSTDVREMPEAGFEALQGGGLGGGLHPRDHGPVQIEGTGGLAALEQALMQLPDRIPQPGELLGREFDGGGKIGQAGQPGGRRVRRRRGCQAPAQDRAGDAGIAPAAPASRSG